MLTLSEAFVQLLSQRGIYKVIGVPDNNVKQVRYKLRHGSGLVSDELKRDWLRKAGYKCAHSEMWYTPGEAIRIEHSPAVYNQADMIEFAKFYHKLGKDARGDDGYAVDKWKLKQKADI